MVRPIGQTRYASSPVKKGQPDYADRRSVSPKKAAPSIRCAALLSGAFASVILFAVISGMVNTPSLTMSSSSDHIPKPAAVVPPHKKEININKPLPVVQLNQPPPSTKETATKSLLNEPHIHAVEPAVGNTAVEARNEKLHTAQETDEPSSIPHQCHYLDSLGSSKERFSFNARPFCLTSAICIKPSLGEEVSTLYSAALPEATKCLNQTVGFENYEEKQPNCTFIKSLTYCAQGRYSPPRTPNCPTIRPLSTLSSAELQTARWTDGIAVVIPAYPHLRNIFHFSFVAGMVAHITTALPTLLSRWQKTSMSEISQPLHVTLVFRGEMPENFGRWQQGVLNVVVNHRLKAAGLEVSITTLNESVGGSMLQNIQAPSSRLLCAKSAVLIGRRSHVNLWPFPSSRMNLGLSGDSVPIEAVALRHATYSAFGINCRVPDSPRGAMQPPERHDFVSLPPLSVGYARRNIYPDPTEDKPYQEGTKRRFSDADEEWFMDMLEEEATASNMAYVTLQSTGETPLSEQVNMFANTGFVAGIHGANLMNTIFMLPFSSLLEIFPSESLACYVAGANSGLAYAKYLPVRKASGEESACPPDHKTCWTLGQNRRVIISEEKDHIELRRLVREGIAHVKHLRRAFSHLGVVPVVYNDELSHYRIDWTKQA